MLKTEKQPLLKTLTTDVKEQFLFWCGIPCLPWVEHILMRTQKCTATKKCNKKLTLVNLDKPWLTWVNIG